MYKVLMVLCFGVLAVNAMDDDHGGVTGGSAGGAMGEASADVLSVATSDVSTHVLGIAPADGASETPTTSTDSGGSSTGYAGGSEGESDTSPVSSPDIRSSDATAEDLNTHLENKSKDVFPDREAPYEKHEVLERFKTSTESSTVYPYLQRFLNVLFHETFPMPVHDNAVIIGGWRCLHIKMLKAYVTDDINPETGARLQASHDQVIASQMHAIYQLVYIHRKSLRKIAPEFAATLPDDVRGCPRCVGAPPKGK